MILMEEFIQALTRLNPILVYTALGLVAYIENIFPPFPSDVLVVAVGSLTAVGSVSFSASLAVATIASTLGFVSMYKVGDWFGTRIIEGKWSRFVPIDQIHKVESWFRRYGIWIVIANRFLAGTRAVVSFFVGMSELPLFLAAVLSLASSLAWNFILLSAGRELGENWREISVYLDAYASIITAVLVLIIAGVIVRRLHIQRLARIHPTNETRKDSEVSGDE